MIKSFWLYLASLNIWAISFCAAGLVIAIIAQRQAYAWITRNRLTLYEKRARAEQIISFSTFSIYILVFLILLFTNRWITYLKSPISNFNSIFEIAIGLNIIFYVFTLLPEFEKSLRKILQEAKDQEEEIVKLGGKKSTYAFGHHLFDNFNGHKNFGKTVCWIGTIISVAFLLGAAFFPKAELYNYVIIIGMLSVSVPTIVSILNIRAVNSWAIGFVYKRREYKDHLELGIPYKPSKRYDSYAEIEDYVEALREMAEMSEKQNPLHNKPST